MKNTCTNLLLTLLLLTGYDSFSEELPQLMWNKNYGGSGHDFATAVHRLPDGTLVFAGYTNSNDNQVSGNHGGYDFWLVKTDSAGELIWYGTF